MANRNFFITVTFTNAMKSNLSAYYVCEKNGEVIFITVENTAVSFPLRMLESFIVYDYEMIYKPFTMSDADLMQTDETYLEEVMERWTKD